MSVRIEASSPYALASGAGKLLSWFSATVTLKASSPDLGVVEVVISPGDEPPLHVHKNEDEWKANMDFAAAALEKFGVGAKEAAEFLAIFERYKKDIVEKP